MGKKVGQKASHPPPAPAIITGRPTLIVPSVSERLGSTIPRHLHLGYPQLSSTTPPMLEPGDTGILCCAGPEATRRAPFRPGPDDAAKSSTAAVATTFAAHTHLGRSTHHAAPSPRSVIAAWPST